jgi:hypothetical protein
MYVLLLELDGNRKLYLSEEEVCAAGSDKEILSAVAKFAKMNSSATNSRTIVNVDLEISLNQYLRIRCSKQKADIFRFQLQKTEKRNGREKNAENSTKKITNTVNSNKESKEEKFERRSIPKEEATSNKSVAFCYGAEKRRFSEEKRRLLAKIG